MREDQAYFNSKAIGSSLLSTFIQSPDHALMQVHPTNYMENGRIWEDLVQYQIIGDKSGFTDKYYRSETDNLPVSQTYRSIPDIMDDDDITQAVADGYIYSKDGSLNARQNARHTLFDEIKENGYKRPIPLECWGKMQKMWHNFSKAQYKGRNIVNMLRSIKDVKFQTIHYWTDISGAECRMKSDIEAVYPTEQGLQGMIIDLKCASNVTEYGNNRNRWQERHYVTGYRQYCLKNKINPPQHMIFAISEQKIPYLTYVDYLENPLEYNRDYIFENQEKYQEHLEACHKWIKAGKKSKGFKERVLDKYFRPIN